jgi:hypothetical protein
MLRGKQGQPKKPVNSIGYDCVNVVVQRAIGKVLSAARKRDMGRNRYNLSVGKTTTTIPQRRSLQPTNSVGFKCVNILVQKAISNVKTKAKARNRAAKWIQKHPDYKPKVSETAKKRQKEKQVSNRDSINSRRRERVQTDLSFACSNRIRSRLKSALKTAGVQKGNSIIEFIGTTWDQLIQHIGDGYSEMEIKDGHVDHIFPLNRFDFSDQAQIASAAHFTNLQILSSHENLSKSAKLPTKAMAAKVDRDKWPPGITEEMLPDIYDGWATPLRMHAE